MECKTAESDLPLIQAERTEDGEEPPPLLHFNAAQGCAPSSRTQITIEIGPQSGTIQLPLLQYRLIRTFSRSRFKAQSGPQSAFRLSTVGLSAASRVVQRIETKALAQMRSLGFDMAPRYAPSLFNRRSLPYPSYIAFWPLDCGPAGAICDLPILNHAQRSCGMIVHPQVLLCLFAILWNRGQPPGSHSPRSWRP
jgi:hypothetical protein